MTQNTILTSQYISLLYTSCAISNPIGKIQSCDQQIYVIQHSWRISFLQLCNIIFVKAGMPWFKKWELEKKTAECYLQAALFQYISKFSNIFYILQNCPNISRKFQKIKKFSLKKLSPHAISFFIEQ